MYSRSVAHPPRYLRGVDLYNDGAFWEAHEAWEDLWRTAAPDSSVHRFLQGLIQCAAACLKAAAGDLDACRRLADRGLAHLERVHADSDGLYMGLELARFIADFRDYAAVRPTDIERRPRLSLRSPSS